MSVTCIVPKVNSSVLILVGARDYTVTVLTDSNPWQGPINRETILYADCWRKLEAMAVV